jgi:hypothetical protein
VSVDHAVFDRITRFISQMQSIRMRGKVSLDVPLRMINEYDDVLIQIED